MQTVSFETAKKLKEAGFPQPEKYQPGMVAYYELAGGENQWSLLTPAETLLTNDDVGEVIAYAPTATELLPEDWLLMREGPNWICQHFEDSHKYVIDDNPAETAALAWLYVNKK